MGRLSMWRIGALAVAVLPLLAGGSLAAVGSKAPESLKKGALYTSAASGCSAGLPGTTCVFHFRANAAGTSLQFKGKTVIDTWHCNGGGGEALLGGTVRGATPIPLVRLRAGGTLYGSLAAVSGSGSKYTVKVTGRIESGGSVAVLTFHTVPAHGTVKCATPPVTLTAA